MKRYIEPLCWAVGLVVLFVWVVVATEVKEETALKVSSKVVAEAAAKPEAEKAHSKAEKAPAKKAEKHAKKAVKEAKKAEKHAKKAETHAKKAETHAKKADAHAKAAEKPAKKAEKAAKKAEKAAEAAAAPAAAGSGEVADVIEMNNPNYKKHKKGICIFTHKKHAEDYKISCGSCHHDKDGKPLESLKMGDPVQNCIACHKKPAKAKVPKGEKWSKEKKREFHADAIHDNCISCHKTWNKENKSKAAPASCKGCHPKKKK